MSLFRSVPRFLIDHSCLALLPVGMHFIDALSLGLSFLGIYGLVFSIRFLIPCYIIPFISAHLTSTQQLLNHAEAINAIPPESEYRTHFDLSANQFAAMRMESNHARGPFQQLRLVVQRGLTCRLCALYYRIEGTRSKLEVVFKSLLLSVTQIKPVLAGD
ncbi:hypothetical protein BJV77DRAFT_603324 [Russula vinacea]|nr:hypothetical protein BJV77DRAFT_603324 [Russula vinacea]